MGALVAGPPNVVTSTATEPIPIPPSVEAGAVAVMLESLVDVKTAVLTPKVTVSWLASGSKLLPAMITELPPPTGPAVGVIEVTAGAVANPSRMGEGPLDVAAR